MTTPAEISTSPQQHVLRKTAIQGLAPPDRNHKFQSGMRRREADDLYTFQTSFATGSEHIVFGNLLLSFGVHDPQSCRAVQTLRQLVDLRQLIRALSGEENPVRRTCRFSVCDALREGTQLGQKLRIKIAEQTNCCIRLDAQFLDSRLWMKNFLAPLFRIST